MTENKEVIVELKPDDELNPEERDTHKMITFYIDNETEGELVSNKKNNKNKTIIKIKVPNETNWEEIACFIPEVKLNDENKYAAWEPEFPSDKTKVHETQVTEFKVKPVENPWQEFIDDPAEREQYIPTCDRGYLARYKKQKPESGLVYEALPLPFFGNVKKPKVIFLSLNPGFNDKTKKELEDAKNPYLRHIAMRSLDTECSTAYYFIGAHYWYKAKKSEPKNDDEKSEEENIVIANLNDLIKKSEGHEDYCDIEKIPGEKRIELLRNLEGVKWWGETLKGPFDNGVSLKNLLENVAVIESFPYHSQNTEDEDFKCEELINLPTVRFSASLVKAAIKKSGDEKKSNNDEITIFIMRSAARWCGLVKGLENLPYYACSNTRRIYLTKNSIIKVERGKFECFYKALRR